MQFCHFFCTFTNCCEDLQNVALIKVLRSTRTKFNTEGQNCVVITQCFHKFPTSRSGHDLFYLNNPHCAKLSLEIRNSNNYCRLPKYSLFPVFFAVSVSTFWALVFFRCFVGFFRRFVGFFRRFKTGKHMQHEKNAKSVRRQKKSRQQ